MITISALAVMGASSSDVSGHGFGLSAVANRLYLFITIMTGTSNSGSITSTANLNWQEVAKVGDSTQRIIIFGCMPTSSVSENVSLGSYGTSTGRCTGLYEVRGVPTGSNGSNAIGVKTSGSNTSANPSLTLPALSADGNSTIMSFFGNNVNPFGGAPETNWTEIFDSGYDLPTAGGYEVRRQTTDDTTVVVTAASSTWIGVAFELKSDQIYGFPFNFY